MVDQARGVDLGGGRAILQQEIAHPPRTGDEIAENFPAHNMIGKVGNEFPIEDGAPFRRTLGKALTGAWFEVMALMNSKNAAGEAALEHMAKASGTDLAGYAAVLTPELHLLPDALAVRLDAYVDR